MTSAVRPAMVCTMKANDAPGTGYGDPSLYDILAVPGTAAEADLLEKLASCLCGPPPWRWLEPACGSGRFLRLLGGRGHRILGFDLDPAMVEYANRGLRRRGLLRRARAVVADLGDCAAVASAGSIDLAFIPDNSIRHLRSDAALQAHLDGMARLMAPRGIYVVGISLADPAGDPPEEDVWTARRGRCRVTQVVNYLPEGREERVLSHLMIVRPGREEHLDLTYVLRTWTEDQWSAELRRSGLCRLHVLDRNGRPRDGRSLPYQLEVLVRADSPLIPPARPTR